MKCALCGFEFTESEAKRPCARCPLGATAILSVVPTVAIKLRKSPKWLRRWRARWRRRNGASEGTLAAMRVGGETEIIAVRPRDQRTLQRLVTMGLVPGVRIRLLRRFPCYLIELGHAQIALDRELASAIIVRADGQQP
jgi:ferrous iron transport protein A